MNKERMKKYLALCLTILQCLILSGQTKPGISLLFYNTENLFDSANDSLKMDEDFTPEGIKHWTYTRMRQKVQNLSKVIIQAGAWEGVAIIGLCEIENRYVLHKLVYETGLKSRRYHIIHHESPDSRGIDVAALVDPAKVRVIHSHFYQVRIAFDSSFRTREILYLSGVTPDHDTLHVFVNHWPSRRGGVEVSSVRRMAAAQKLRQVVDSIQQKVPHAHIIIMGDFNDHPEGASLTKILKARIETSNMEITDLVNCMARFSGNPLKGTHKFNGEWGILDQFIVSASFFTAREDLKRKPPEVRIIDFPFLLEDDNRFFGKQPFRTYNGLRYQGGYSDHLPVMLKVFFP